MSVPQKIWQLDPWDEEGTSHVTLRQKEVIVGASSTSFLHVNEDGISLYGGSPSRITLGTLSPSYCSFVVDMPWPATLLASFYAPPKQMPNPALFENLATMAMAASALTALISPI
tara:strand:+ start:2553 stop:2897 length:345 start_codon:yes stop_codon:yes gene_type:complete